LENLSGLAWDISFDGMRQLSEADKTGHNIFSSNHGFYYDALKPGPQVDSLTIKFLHDFQKTLDEFEAQELSNDMSFYNLSCLMLASAELVQSSLFFFVNRIPRLFVKEYFHGRDWVQATFMNYLLDEINKEESAPMI
jgi:hypothetical protein